MKELDISKIRLIIVDLDGTMLDDAAELSETNIRAVRRCEEAGINVVIATARPPRSARPFYETLGLSTPSVHYNGALIHWYDTGEIIHHSPIPGPLAREIAQRSLAIDADALVSLEVCDRWYMNRAAAFATKTAEAGFIPDFIGDLEQFFNEPVTKVLVSMPTVGDEVGFSRLMREFDGKLSFTKAEESVLQIMNNGVTKGMAVRKIMEYFKLSKEECAAMGDAPNDIPMLEAVALPIAMGNAYPETQAVAQHITGKNSESGAGAAINAIIDGILQPENVS